MEPSRRLLFIDQTINSTSGGQGRFPGQLREGLLSFISGPRLAVVDDIDIALDFRADEHFILVLRRDDAQKHRPEHIWSSEEFLVVRLKALSP